MSFPRRRNGPVAPQETALVAHILYSLNFLFKKRYNHCLWWGVNNHVSCLEKIIIKKKTFCTWQGTVGRTPIFDWPAVGHFESLDRRTRLKSGVFLRHTNKLRTCTQLRMSSFTHQAAPSTSKQHTTVNRNQSSSFLPLLPVMMFLLVGLVSVIRADECQLTPVIHVLQYPGCIPKPIPSFACTGKCTSYVQVIIKKIEKLYKL
jgi:hypothetical protein